MLGNWSISSVHALPGKSAFIFKNMYNILWWPVNFVCYIGPAPHKMVLIVSTIIWHGEGQMWDKKKGGGGKYIGRGGWGAAYLQRCWCSTNEQTKGLSYQRCGGGQGHEEQVPSSFWRLFSHPVDYTTVHDWTNHLEGWIFYHYLCECARTKQHLWNCSNVTWNGTSAMVLAK